MKISVPNLTKEVFINIIYVSKDLKMFVLFREFPKKILANWALHVNQKTRETVQQIPNHPKQLIR